MNALVKVLEPIAEIAFQITHQPSCQDTPYLVRLAGAGKKSIDGKSVHETGDALAWGTGLDDALETALLNRKKQEETA